MSDQDQDIAVMVALAHEISEGHEEKFHLPVEAMIKALANTVVVLADSKTPNQAVNA